MVEKRGSSVSLSQMTYLLYESIEENRKKQPEGNLLHTYAEILRNMGLEHILIKKQGSYAVDTVLCDFYEFIEGSPDYITLFSGSYMPGIFLGRGYIAVSEEFIPKIQWSAEMT